jgi:hypothetical protein
MSGTEALYCADEQQRRADVIAHPTRNGIDYIEVDPADHAILRVTFIKPLPPANVADPSDPHDAYGLTADLTRIRITGGTRIVGIKPVAATRQPDGTLVIAVDRAGDYSLYALTLDAPEMDAVLRRVLFSFMASCPVDFDCRPVEECLPEPLEEPLLDYQAKDYASFRRLMLDLLPRLNPQFVERNPSDLGIALIELLAYTGDHLSYFQDAVANEAFLETLRQRISARRHAQLVDYRMHDGRNAWTHVQVTVSAPGPLPQGSKVVTRIVAPLARQVAPPGAVLDEAAITTETLERDPALVSTAVFETAHPAEFDPRNNEIFLHTWGNENCCLGPGATEAFLFTRAAGSSTAVRPVLRKGDYLLVEEVKGPLTGIAPDADPEHRQVVWIDEDPLETTDPLYSDQLIQDVSQEWQVQRWLPGQQELPLLRVRWRREDALRFPLCLSNRTPERGLIRNVSVARGNLVLADHGLTTTESITLESPVPPDEPFRLRLSQGPLTMQCAPERLEYDPATGRPATERRHLTCDARDAQPAVALLASLPTGTQLWTPVPNLLDSPPFAEHFVAEVDDEGRAILRFGDGEYGREPAGAVAFQTVYRIGNGRAGNIGANALAHLALPGPANWIEAVRNPIAAQGGVDPETIEEVRQRAPQAFHAEQFRAVTEDDYAVAARRLPEVHSAVASFRWTGSWHTVFVGVDPRDPADLITLPNGRTQLAPRLERRVSSFLTRYRLAGYDLAIRAPTFVSLEIDVALCAMPGHFRGDVARAVAGALSSRVLPDGRRGFFHPDNFRFGQPVYLSQLYAAIERVEGVDSAEITRFRRFGQADDGEIASGVLSIGPWEIARLENDPSFMEHGVLRITARGGKA